MLQQAMYECADLRNSKLPNFVARRVLDFVRLCSRSKQGEFYLSLVRLVHSYSLYMTGV